MNTDDGQPLDAEDAQQIVIGVICEEDKKLRKKEGDTNMFR